MALLFMDGFDHYNTVGDLVVKWSRYTSVYLDPTFVAGRYGGGALSYSRGGGSGIYRSVPSPTTAIVGMAIKWTAFAGAANFLKFWLDSTCLMGLRLDLSGTLTITNGAGTGLATSAAAIIPGSWNYVEYKVFFNASGTAEVRANGVTMVTYSGSTIAYGAAPNSFSLHPDYPADTSNRFYGDDLYLCNGLGTSNNDFLGDIRIEYLVPTGAGVRTQFAPSAGSNWQNIDESPASDADYNSSNVPGAMDLFVMTNLAGNGLVHGVQTISRAKKDDAGFRKAEPVFYKASGLGSTARFYKGSKEPVLDSFTNLPIQVFSASPDTGVAWTIDEINALQYGYAVGDAGMFTLDARLV